MSVKYSKNEVVAASDRVSTANMEATIEVQAAPGTVVTFDALNGVVRPANTGELFVLNNDFTNTAKVKYEAGDRVRYIKAHAGEVLNLILAPNLDVKAGYALFVNEAGQVTNVAPDKTAAAFGYARESVVTTDAPAQIATFID